MAAKNFVTRISDMFSSLLLLLLLLLLYVILIIIIIPNYYNPNYNVKALTY